MFQKIASASTEFAYAKAPPGADSHILTTIPKTVKHPFADSKTLEGFNWQFNPKAFDRMQIEELATGDFIRRRNNLIMVGWSGIGKSHIMQALGQKACVQGYRVLYRTSAELLADLTASLADKTLPTRLRYYARPDLLIIDEFGFDRIERTECPQSASALQNHRLTQPEALHRAGDQRRLRQMGRVYDRWPAGDGFPRSSSRRGDPPQGYRQVLSRRPSQRRGQARSERRKQSLLPHSCAYSRPERNPTTGSFSTAKLAPFFAATDKFWQVATSPCCQRALPDVISARNISWNAHGLPRLLMAWQCDDPALIRSSYSLLNALLGQSRFWLRTTGSVCAHAASAVKMSRSRSTYAPGCSPKEACIFNSA